MRGLLNSISGIRRSSEREHGSPLRGPAEIPEDREPDELQSMKRKESWATAEVTEHAIFVK